LLFKDIVTHWLLGLSNSVLATTKRATLQHLQSTYGPLPHVWFSFMHLTHCNEIEQHFRSCLLSPNYSYLFISWNKLLNNCLERFSVFMLNKKFVGLAKVGTGHCLLPPQFFFFSMWEPFTWNLQGHLFFNFMAMACLSLSFWSSLYFGVQAYYLNMHRSWII